MSEDAAAARSSATAELTRRLARGDEAAFREFHAQYFDRIHRFLLVVGRGDAGVAAEALQETMVRVARYARVFEREDVFWDWLKVVARSAARDQGRKQRRYASLLERFSGWAHIAADRASTEDTDLRASLEECLAELAGAERVLIERKYLHGLTVAELASEVGLTEKAVEARLSRLRQTLAARIMEKLRRS